MSKDELSKLILNLHKAQEKDDSDLIIEELLKLSQYHYNNSNFIKAKLFLKEILDIRKDVANVNYYLALIEIENNNYELAVDHINKELKINPKNVYAKEIKERLNINSNFPLVTIFLILLNFMTFIYVYPKITLVDAIKFGLSDLNFTFNNLITSIFFHINIYHFLANMVVLLFFGLILEKKIGSIRFLFIYLTSAIFGNAVQILLYDNSIVIGASAGLFGILGSLMMRVPLLTVRILGFFKVPLIIVLGAFITVSTLLSIFSELSFISGDIAHMAGLLVGILLTGFLYLDSTHVFYNWLFITLGFMVIQYGIESIIQIYFISEIIIYLLLILFGVLVVVFSYYSLKNNIISGGEIDETDL